MLELALRGVRSKLVKKVAYGAATKAVTRAVAAGGIYLVREGEGWKRRRLAMDLARQIGGQVSVRTVIDGNRYYVVWRGDKPVDCFPALPKNAGRLDERPELIGFVGRRVTPKPGRSDREPRA